MSSEFLALLTERQALSDLAFEQGFKCVFFGPAGSF